MLGSEKWKQIWNPHKNLNRNQFGSPDISILKFFFKAIYKKKKKCSLCPCVRYAPVPIGSRRDHLFVAGSWEPCCCSLAGGIWIWSNTSKVSQRKWCIKQNCWCGDYIAISLGLYMVFPQICSIHVSAHRASSVDLLFSWVLVEYWWQVLSCRALNTMEELHGLNLVNYLTWESELWECH